MSFGRCVQAFGAQGEPAAGQSSLAASGLTHEVACLAAAAIAPSSRRTYSASEAKYIEFCTRYNCAALPGTDIVLSYYAASLTRSLRPSSVRTYMSAIRNLHMELGLDYPSGPACLLSRVMKGVGRSTGGTRTRLPITTPILRSLCQCLVNSKIRHPHMGRWRSDSVIRYLHANPADILQISQRL